MVLQPLLYTKLGSARSPNSHHLVRCTSIHRAKVSNSQHSNSDGPENVKRVSADARAEEAVGQNHAAVTIASVRAHIHGRTEEAAEGRTDAALLAAELGLVALRRRAT